MAEFEWSIGVEVVGFFCLRPWRCLGEHVSNEGRILDSSLGGEEQKRGQSAVWKVIPNFKPGGF